MIETDKPNPFHVLRLSIHATKKEIVERGQELYDTAETEEQRQLYRWAKEQLLTNVHTRLVYALFEMPDTQYDNPEWEQFIRLYRKNPVRLETLVKSIPAITEEDFDISAMIQQILQGFLTVPDADITTAVNGSPFMARSKPTLEVRDVIFG